MLVQKEARIETPLLKLRQEELHLAIYKCGDLGRVCCQALCMCQCPRTGTGG